MESIKFRISQWLTDITPATELLLTSGQTAAYTRFILPMPTKQEDSQ